MVIIGVAKAARRPEDRDTRCGAVRRDAAGVVRSGVFRRRIELNGGGLDNAPHATYDGGSQQRSSAPRQDWEVKTAVKPTVKQPVEVPRSKEPYEAGTQGREVLDRGVLDTPSHRS